MRLHTVFAKHLTIRWPLLAIFAALILGAVQEGYGQIPSTRIYATSQNSGGALLRFVDNAEDAVDGNPGTHSTIGVTLIGEVWQRLQFSSTINANTTVRVKIGTSGDLLSLLGNIQIQAFHNGNAVGNAVALSTLITLIAGEDQAEIAFTPNSQFNAVRIRSSGVALGGGLKIYEAYYLTPATDDLGCDLPADILYGSSSGLVGGLNTVSTPQAAIDGNLNSSATIRSNVGVANETHLTALYNTPSHTGDSIRIILRRPGALLDLSVLSDAVKISTMLDSDDHGELQPELLSLRLLPSSSNIYEVVLPTTLPHNRIKVSISGVADVLTSLEVFEIQRKLAKPILSAPAMNNNEATICEDETLNISVNNAISGSSYLWYTSPTGGTAFHTGNTYTATPLNPGELNYYVARTLNGCTEESERTAIKVNVTPLPGRASLSITNSSN